jgi:large subunit ribosomal protein L14e
VWGKSQPLYTRFVEIGRVALINYGPNEGKLCVIIDVVDGNRALVDGPSSITGVARQAVQLKNLSLTDFKIDIPRSPRLKTLAAAFVAGEIEKKWAATAWAQRRARGEARAQLNDFDRFKVMVARKERARKVKSELRSLKKAHNKTVGSKKALSKFMQ